MIYLITCPATFLLVKPTGKARIFLSSIRRPFDVICDIPLRRPFYVTKHPLQQKEEKRYAALRFLSGNVYTHNATRLPTIPVQTKEGGKHFLHLHIVDYKMIVSRRL